MLKISQIENYLLRTAIQIHFHRCIEVHTAINGTFGRVENADSRYFVIKV
jgi:hypothetical protein